MDVMRLNELPPHEAATIRVIDWSALKTGEARRMRELGFDEGVRVETLHRGPMGMDPLACRVGRMTIALRRRTAAAVSVEPYAMAAE
jgi:ferrous iron transport protein A